MRTFFILATTLSLSGCGAIYYSPSVIEEVTAGGLVTVMQIDTSSVARANGSPHQPKKLPAVFSRITRSGSDLDSPSVVPDPALLPEIRPGFAETRLPPDSTPGSYRIGVSDVVLISSPQVGNTVEELSGLLAAQNRRQGYTVQDDGSIALPDVGRVQLGGLTMEEAEAALFQRLVESQKNPAFSLEIAEFNSQRIIVGGEVKSSVVIPITLTSLTLGEALSTAGGVSAADPDFAIIRLYRDGTIYQIPLNAYLADQGIQEINLLHGDNIFVDAEFDLAKAQAYFEQQIKLSELRQSDRTAALDQLRTEVTLRRTELDEARTNYQTRVDLDAIDRDYVYLAGEVRVQGRYTLPFERKASLADAIFDQSAGIPVRTANMTEIYVLRAQANEAGITAWQLDAGNAANLVLATQFELRPNDVVFVAEQPVTVWSRVINQITPSVITPTIGSISN